MATAAFEATRQIVGACVVRGQAWLHCSGLIVLGCCSLAHADPLGADRIAELPEDVRPAWEDYWDRSQRLRAQDETLVQRELDALGDDAEWRPAPTGRMLPRRAWRSQPNWYASDDARQVATNLLSFQTPAGGWSKNVAIGTAARESGMGFGEGRAHYRGTFDNNATTSPMRVLGRIAMAQNHAPSREGFLRGLQYILDAQYPNGGWPQVYPLEGGYHDNVTFNDGAMIHILELLQDVADGGYTFVAEPERAAVRQAIAGGEDYILRSQVVQDGVKTVWCAQHDPLNLQPARARSYEWASLSGGESAGIVLYLMDQAPQNDSVCAAVEAAHDWFQANAIYGKEFRMRELKLVDREGAGPLWARFYELGSGRPMFVERNATHAVYALEELPMSSNGYAWYTGAPRRVLDRYPSWKSGSPSAN